MEAIRGLNGTSSPRPPGLSGQRHTLRPQRLRTGLREVPLANNRATGPVTTKRCDISPETAGDANPGPMATPGRRYAAAIRIAIRLGSTGNSSTRSSAGSRII